MAPSRPAISKPEPKQGKPAEDDHASDSHHSREGADTDAAAEDSSVLDSGGNCEDGDGNDILLNPESADEEEDPLPTRDEQTGRVCQGAAPHEYLGRISGIKQGAHHEAVSIYCSLHGCAFMKRIH